MASCVGGWEVTCSSDGGVHEVLGRSSHAVSTPLMSAHPVRMPCSPAMISYTSDPCKWHSETAVTVELGPPVVFETAGEDPVVV
jgi:hypothetical protein